MLIFDQLRVSDDGKNLFIDMHVNTSSYYENVTLESITIIPALSSAGEIQISETNCAPPEDNYIYKKEYPAGVKSDTIVIDDTVLAEAFINTDSEGQPINDGPTAKASFSGGFSNNLFFVYVKCQIPAAQLNPCVPCDSASAMTTIGVTFDEVLMYQKVMQFTKTLINKCDIPKEFIDLILLWNGFKASIETEHFIPAIDFWKKMFLDNHSLPNTSSNICGCHG